MASSATTGTMTNANGSLMLSTRSWTISDSEPRGAIFLVHGFAEHSGRYEKVAEFLNSEGFEVFAVDHQGHGQSEGERAHVEKFSDYADDLEHFIRETTESRPAIAEVPRFLMGHSIGATLAAHVATRPAFESLRIRGVVLLSAQMAAPKGALTKSLRSKAASNPKAELGVANRTLTTPLTHDAESDAAYQADPLVYHGLARAGFTCTALMAMDEVSAKAAAFNAPLLMVHGTANAINKASEAERWFSAAGSADKTFEKVNGALHELHNEAEPYQADFRSKLSSWLSSRCTTVASRDLLAIVETTADETETETETTTTPMVWGQLGTMGMMTHPMAFAGAYPPMMMGY